MPPGFKKPDYTLNSLFAYTLNRAAFQPHYIYMYNCLAILETPIIWCLGVLQRFLYFMDTHLIALNISKSFEEHMNDKFALFAILNSVLPNKATWHPESLPTLGRVFACSLTESSH